jgi:hypothetical protein
MIEPNKIGDKLSDIITEVSVVMVALNASKDSNAKIAGLCHGELMVSGTLPILSHIQDELQVVRDSAEKLVESAGA